ncbi:hypothetical protein D3C86_1878600 [compost metagenome]
MVKRLAETGQILCAKVSTAMGRIRHHNHVICIYTDDWRNRDALLTTRYVLRSAGFYEELGYKRDCDTAHQLYGPEEWWLRA